jgi:hypothetical protein
MCAGRLFGKVVQWRFMSETVPNVFISHSSADKDSVEVLAQALAQNGVDPWYAGWEIGPGDSIVQKINEGLEGCDAFIIVVSENSVRSKWVREELNSAVVERIEREAEIIPVRLDRSPVPPIINHLRWVELHPLEEHIEELVKAIFGVSDKPPVGEAPDYVRWARERGEMAIGGLTPEASAILRYLILEDGLDSQTSSHVLRETLRLSDTEVEDGLDELEELGLVRELGPMGGVATPKATAWLYLDREDLGFDVQRDMLTVAQCVAGHERVDTTTLEADTGLPQKRIDVAALILQDHGIVHLIQTLGTAPYHFAEAWATSSTRRWLRNNPS